MSRSHRRVGGNSKLGSSRVAAMWQRGDVVVLRYGREASADYQFTGGLPLYVISHSEHQLVAYLAEGTETAAPVLAAGRGLRDVALEERWAHPRISVSRPGDEATL